MFDKPTLRQLRDDIDAALVTVGKKHGMSLTAGNASFNASNATFKLDCSMFNSDGEAETREMIDLKAFFPEMVGLEVSLGGIIGKVVGLSRRAKKYPFIVETTKGLFKASAEQVGAGAAFVPR